MLKEIEQPSSGVWQWICQPNVFIGLLLSSLCINLLSLVFPLMLLQIYDRIIPNAAVSTLTLLVLGVGVALLFETVLRIARSIINAWSEARVEYQLECNTFKHLIKTPVTAFEEKSAGYHLEALSTLKNLKNAFGDQYIVTFLDLLFVFVYLALLAYLGGVLIFVSFAVILFFATTALITGWHLQRILSERRVIDDRRMSFIIETLSGIQTLKAMAMEAFMLRRYERLQQGSGKYDYKLALLSSTAHSVGSFISQLGVVLIVAFGAVRVIHGNMTIGTLAACTILASRTLQPINQAMSFWKRWQTIRMAKERFKEIQSLPQEDVKTSYNKNLLKGKVEVKNLSFSFKKNTPLLTHLNLSVEPGECIALMGDGLSGRSTFLWLLLGLLKGDHGEVLFDGEPAPNYDPAYLRNAIAYLPQVGVLFEGTIMENMISFRGPEYQEEARRVAKLLGVEEKILRLPDGYETKVGNRGVEVLTPGLRQRIVIARALVNKPKILLFDEASIGLDRESEEALKEALSQMKGECTIFLVSHKISLLKIADRICHFKDGNVKEEHYVISNSV